MNIRLAHADDQRSVERCVAEAYAGYITRLGKRPASMDRAFLPLIQAGCVYVCETDQGIDGAMVITEHADQIEVSSVAVRPGAQGRGIGKRLMQAAESIAIARGYRKLTLYTNAALPELIRYYEQLGYKQTERRMDEEFDRVFFQKEVVSDA